ncbi:hypothetical protein JJC04_16230 [Flavobacterium covae]|nr:hypothetical protein [Flavobacterium covae]QYS91246.1 hypothetical protein JJC04_16230 [Flavobacterium covae]
MSNKSGNYIEIAGGSITEHCTGEYNLFAQKMSFNAEGTVSINGAQKGTSYKTPIEPPKIVLNQGKVKKVELVTNLDLGSKNDKSGGTQLGMIFGKEYTFQVTQYDNETPLTRRLTKWQMRYHSPKYSQNKWIDVPLKVTEDTVKITMNEEDMCGRFIYVRAYIDDPKSEGETKVWKHNRFRWFDKMVVYEQAEARAKEPWRIDQGGTSLCGMASLFYLLAKKDGKGYEKLAKELFRTGEYKYNKYIVKPHENAIEMYSVNPYKDKDHPKLPEVDWLTLACVRSKESSFFGKLLYKGKKGQDAEAINWPTLMKPLGKNLLGYTDVEMDYYKVNKSYLRDFFGSDEKLRILEKDIDVDFKNGYQICLLIDGTMVDYKPGDDYSLDDFSEYHWVVYEGGLEILNGLKPESDYDNVTNINFNVFTWGELRNDSVNPTSGLPMRKIRLTKNQFRSNYYGYLKLK